MTVNRWVNDDLLDLQLDEIAESDEACACSEQPGTYYEACDPDAWVNDNAYSLGDVVRPSTRNGYVYECTTGGTSQSGSENEPSWPTTAGNTVNDGTVVWTCRANYCLAGVALDSGDFSVGNGDVSGRKVTMAQQSSVSIHTTGTAKCLALLDGTEKRLNLVNPSTEQAVVSGNTMDFPAFDYESRDPSES